VNVSSASCYVLGAVLVCAPPAARAQDLLVGKVVAVQDGDTITLLDGDEKQHRIRLAGIDAPERAQPAGALAQEHLADLAYARLVLAHCSKVDQYRRRVCTVFVSGRDVGLAQVEAGWAWHFKRFAHEQLPAERDAYTRAEEAARAKKAGLWAEDAPLPPWEWRRGPTPAQ
jgi:endonuclease YncB( thermonuclease family)